MNNKFSKILMSALLLATGLGFTSCSDDDLDTNPYNKDGVSIVTYGPCPLTRGETMEMTGTEFGKVAKVLFPQGNMLNQEIKNFEEAQFTRTSDQKMTVTVPDQVVPGAIRVVTNSGDTVISRGGTSFVEEIRVDDYAPKTSVRPGDVITITGEFVWNIAEVTFANNVKVLAEDFLVNTRKEVQVQIPLEAQSGTVTYNNGAEDGEELTLCDLDVYGPTIDRASNENPEFGETITLYGKDFDLVTNVTMPSTDSLDFTVSDDATQLTFTIPTTVSGGEITFTQYSGVTFSYSVNMPLATVASASPNKDLKAGDVVTLTGTNLDRITKLELPGADDTKIELPKGAFTQSTTEISFEVPEDMVDGTVVLYQHENYSIESPRIAMHHEGSETPIWTGTCVVGEWDSSMSSLSWGGYDWSTVQVGQELIIHLTMNAGASYSQLRVGNGSWAALPGTSDPYVLDETTTEVRITLTEAMINTLVNEGGLVLCGANFTVTQVSLSSLEMTIWEGTQDLGSWSINYEISGDCFMGNAVANKVLKFYVEAYNDWSQIQIFDGHWGGLAFANNGSSNNFNSGMDQWAAHPTYYEVTITAEEAERLNTYYDWGYCMIVQGEGCILKKITLQ